MSITEWAFEIYNGIPAVKASGCQGENQVVFRRVNLK